jgi:AcrR family transcriptional regulator
LSAASSAARAPRRRQARSEASRARILDAVIALVEEGGFGAATAQAIAREAELSVGAVQHHFPSKEAVLDAVLEESAARFAACFADGPPTTGDVVARVDAFVDRAWRHYGSPFFRAAQEIVLGSRRSRAGDEAGPPAAVMASARVAERVWRERFGDLDLGRAVHRDLRRYAFASLTGLALLARFEPDVRRLDRPLAHLKTGLGASLEAAMSSRPS